MALCVTEVKDRADKPCPETVIYRIRESHPDMVRVFTMGGCYSMYLILASIFPGAVCYYDTLEGHIWTWIDDGNDGDFYDITGRMPGKRRAAVRLVRLPNPNHKPGPGEDGWGMSNNEWVRHKKLVQENDNG